MGTNVVGHFFMSKAAFRQAFKKQRSGVIVTVTAAFWNGMPLMAHTGAARAATDNLTKTLAVEWQKYGVRVNQVAPGLIHSGALERYPKAFQDQIMKSAHKQNLAYRRGSSAEVTNGIIFLLSPGAAFITGTSLKIDAGECIWNLKYP